MITTAISKVTERINLTRKETKRVFDEIMKGNCSEDEIVSFLIELTEKGETIEEIQGACESMREVSAKVNYLGEENLLDVVGTGGDNKNSFNISTVSAIICAGAGCIVAKHGNRSVSSNSGSAEVFRTLGVNIETTSERNSEILSKIGLAFLFAPLHHPAMKYAINARRKIGKRTIFNILGPITNPANANCYLLGAYSEELAEKLANVLSGLNTKKALVVHGSGYDEACLTGKTIIFEVTNGKIDRKEITPEKFGIKKGKEEYLVVSGPEESAKIIKEILSGKERGAKRDIVLLNSGLAIYASEKADSIAQGLTLAKESIDSGKAMEKLNELIKETIE